MINRESYKGKSLFHVKVVLSSKGACMFATSRNLISYKQNEDRTVYMVEVREQPFDFYGGGGGRKT